MSLMPIRLALRLLAREARSGELTLILMALLIAVTSTTAIALFSARLDLAMQSRSNDLLGADLRLKSTSLINDAWRQEAQQRGIETARTLTFPSVVLKGDEMSLAAIKAVDDGYPLRGRLLISDQAYQQAASHTLATQGPRPGEVWVEPRLLALLQAKVGDNIELGEGEYRISAVILEESDRGGNFYTLSPRVMVHWQDIENSSLLGPGSRLQYRLLLKGDNDVLQQLRNGWQLDANQSFESLQDSNQAMSDALDRARRYLGLAALLAVVLASVAVAICAQRYAQRHYDISALMRTFGLQQRQVYQIYAWQLMVLGLAATLVGAALAALLQQGLIQLLQGILPENLPSAPLSAWLLGASSGVLTLLGFALPYILPLSRVTPLRVLRRDITPVPLSGWLITLLALVALTLLLWFFTQDMPLTLGMMLGGSVVVLVLLMALHGLIAALRQPLARINLPLTLRFAWQHLSRNSRQTAGQILAFSLTLLVMVVIGVVRNDLLADWQASLPEDAPNVFAINIQPYEKDEFYQRIEAAGYRTERLYTMVPGRLVAINDQDIQTLAVASDRALNRDLALTSDSQLPASNRIIAGDWQTLLTQKNQVSIEQDLAQRLNVGLGDQLAFRAGGVDFEATISSIREVDWGSLSPNFYMMFSPDVLERLPGSFLTSFYVPAEKQQALTQLIRDFPTVTLLDMQIVLGQIQTLLIQVSLAVELILSFVLIAAGLVMIATLIASLNERLREGAILRTLGADRGVIRRAQMAEFSLLALISALFALVGGEMIVFGLYQYLLNIPYAGVFQGLGWAWLWLPPMTILVLVLVGRFLMRAAVNVAPLTVLRELE
ncbi:ABC transporter permease [Bacterioplanoides sp.]|uniref:ABC transporter permease n=1 Tax=Bacterioplanoides sp. TaxID=2066072 RepID=UPI003B003459